MRTFIFTLLLILGPYSAQAKTNMVCHLLASEGNAPEKVLKTLKAIDLDSSDEESLSDLVDIEKDRVGVVVNWVDHKLEITVAYGKRDATPFRLLHARGTFSEDMIRALKVGDSFDIREIESERHYIVRCFKD